MNNILKNITTSSFRQIINSRERTNLRMFSGKATEQYIFRNIDNALEKLDIEGWVLYVPSSLKVTKNEKHVHFLMKKDYLSKKDEELLISTFLKIDNDKSNFTKVCLIYFDEVSTSLNVKVSNKLDSSMKEYDSYTSFMQDTYNIDINPYVDELNDNLMKSSFINKDFEESINFLEKKADVLTKLNVLIFDDLFTLLSRDGIKFYPTNLDAIVKKNDTSFAIVEVKNKTKFPFVIINKSELEIYESLANDIDVYFYILMSYNELDTKRNLLINDFVYGDTELYYYKVDPEEFPLFKLTIENGSSCYNIPLGYLKKCNTLLQDEMIDLTIKRIPSVLQTSGYINNRDYLKFSKILVASELKKANIIQSIFDIEETNKGNLFYVKVNGKKVAIKYVKNKSWRMEISEKEFDMFSKEKIDYILILKLYGKGENSENISIIGYIPLCEIPSKANKVAKLSGITTNRIFWEFCSKSKAEKDAEIAINGSTYILSINSGDGRHIGVKPFYEIPKFSKKSIKDFS